jgi:hypothetical protein
MNKLLLLAFYFVFSINAFAQVTFEPGYFIDNDGNRINCLIKNTDRTLNPTQFEYKLSDGNASILATIDNVQEFEILNTVHKYQRFTVNIDRSANATKELGYSREPEFKQEQLFLRVLVEGNATLYEYNGSRGLQRYFYKKDTSEVEQLVYKKYLITETGIGENSSYKQQLSYVLNCPTFTFEQINNINYNEKDLVEIFTNYNTCIGSEYADYTSKKLKGKFEFAVKAGINSSSLKVEQFVVLVAMASGSSKMSVTKHAITNSRTEQSPRIGFEIERNLPFNKYKWSLYIEPTFQYFKTKNELIVYRRVEVPETPTRKAYVALAQEEGTLTVDYSHITVPIGVRHYFFLNNGSKLFLSGAIAPNFLINSSKSLKAEGYNIQQPEFNQSGFNLKPSFTFALGYKLKNKFSLEADYSAGKRMLEDNMWQTKFINSFSAMVGYKFY